MTPSTHSRLKTLGRLYDRVFGNPWVYDHVRPWVLGGFDFSIVYAWLCSTGDDVILDVGCGTGATLAHVQDFRAYYGFDTDSRALTKLQRRFPNERVHVQLKTPTPSDVQEIKPTLAVAMGLLHHLSDDEVLDLFATLAASGTVQRVITLDTVYLPGQWTNNLLAALDRGRHTRTPNGYRRLIEHTGFVQTQETHCSAGRGIATYLGMALEPKR